MAAREYGKRRRVERRRGGSAGGGPFAEGEEVTGVKVEVEGSGIGSVTVSEGFTNVFGRFVLVVSKLSTKMVFWLFRGGEGEIGGREGETGVGVHVAEGRSKEGESQDGGDPGSSSTVVPGSREEGSTSRCSMNVTWKELKHFPVEMSHKRYAFELGAYPISVQGLERW